MVTVQPIREGLASEIVLKDAVARRRDACPFVRWHLRTKFEAMEKLFHRYLHADTKFVDMACGTGDGLLLASLCQPQSEIWGLDIYRPDLDLARSRVPSAHLVEGDMVNPNLPKGYFDVVHEFGATFMIPQWTAVIESYLSLLRDGGILLWELPQKWSTGHIAYLLSVAPKITESDTKFKRILRTFSPSKYRYESDAAVLQAIEAAGCEYEILERVPLWYFYCRGLMCKSLDYAWRFKGDALFDWCDRAAQRLWPRYSGYYLVIKKVHAR